jgi:hypothetical protein
LYSVLVDLQSEENRIAAEKKRIKEKLASLIPEGERVSGVKHTVVSSRSVSWKSVAEAAKVALVPRTKWGDYEQITFAHTKTSLYDKFSMVEE